MVKEWIPLSVRRRSTKNACETCGSTSRLGLHHQFRVRTNNSPENLQTLCPTCHTALHWQEGKRAWRLHSASCDVCGKPAKRSGLCETHRTRQRRHGSPYLRRRKVGRSWQLMDERTGRASGLA